MACGGQRVAERPVSQEVAADYPGLPKGQTISSRAVKMITSSQRKCCFDLVFAETWMEELTMQLSIVSFPMNFYLYVLVIS